jgi:hypothetical protein
MNCKELQTQLAILTPDELSSSGGPAEHLQTCPVCRQQALEWQQFDQSVRRALQQTPVPEGLAERLLLQLQQTQPVSVSVTPRRSRSWITRRIWQFTALTLLVLGLVTVWWRPVPSAPPAVWEFAQVQQQLAEQLPDEGGLESLPPWSGDADVTAISAELRRFRLSAPRGLNLDQSAEPDAVVYTFQHKSWRGVLVAVPNNRLLNAPAAPAPPADSHQRRFAWQSQDGQWTYICHVHAGPPQGILQSLFGGLG